MVVLFALHAVAKGEPISIFRFKICLFSQFVTFKFYVLDLEASERRKKGDKYSHIQAKVQCFVSAIPKKDTGSGRSDTGYDFFFG